MDTERGFADRLAIRELIENWVIWRDSGDWERFATLWHEDGQMSATWFQDSASDFTARCRRAFEAGALVLHSLGGSNIEVNGTRGISQTKMQIWQRAEVHGVAVDVTCSGRFIDAWEKRGEHWALLLRQAAYDLDRLTPVDPSLTVKLDPVLLASFPVGYRHLAYLQTQQGMTVKNNLAGTRGPEIAALHEARRRWLAGGLLEKGLDTSGSH
jgi:SnoaL-like domain